MRYLGSTFRCSACGPCQRTNMPVNVLTRGSVPLNGRSSFVNLWVAMPACWDACSTGHPCMPHMQHACTINVRNFPWQDPAQQLEESSAAHRRRAPPEGTRFETRIRALMGKSVQSMCSSGPASSTVRHWVAPRWPCSASHERQGCGGCADPRRRATSAAAGAAPAADRPVPRAAAGAGTCPKYTGPAQRHACFTARISACRADTSPSA